MRPVRFVALSEDGHAFVLADEVGRLLALPIDDRVQSALRTDGTDADGKAAPLARSDLPSTLAPRDIQARIRAGDSAEDVARVAGVPVDRVLRYAGPVLQERAMLAQHARRTRLKASDKGVSLAEVVDARLALHGVDTEKISWDAFRRDDGTWRIIATWPSGKATAQATWELDKSRQLVAPHDDMAQYLCAERPTQILGQDPTPGRGLGGESTRSGHEPMVRPGRGLGADPIRSGRDALLASLDRPLETSGRGLGTGGEGGRLSRPAASAATIERENEGGGGGGGGSKEVPTVPSLAVLRPRRNAQPAAGEQTSEQPRKRLPSWDDVLFGTAPAARETS